jgi:hypothetical protein
VSFGLTGGEEGHSNPECELPRSFRQDEKVCSDWQESISSRECFDTRLLALGNLGVMLAVSALMLEIVTA